MVKGQRECVEGEIRLNAPACLMACFLRVFVIPRQSSEDPCRSILPQTNVMNHFVSAYERNTQKCMYIKHRENSQENGCYFQCQILLSSDTCVRPKLRRVDACLGIEII